MHGTRSTGRTVTVRTNALVLLTHCGCRARAHRIRGRAHRIRARGLGGRCLRVPAPRGLSLGFITADETVGAVCDRPEVSVGDLVVWVGAHPTRGVVLALPPLPGIALNEEIT